MMKIESIRLTDLKARDGVTAITDTTTAKATGTIGIMETAKAADTDVMADEAKRRACPPCWRANPTPCCCLWEP